MRKIYFFLIILAVLLALAVFYFPPRFDQPQDLAGQEQDSGNLPEKEEAELVDFQPPLDRIEEREVKKPFGIYITPENSPIQPERFQGYHTGVDFEILSGESTAEVLVYAVCLGKLELKQFGNGYGGLAVQSCQLDKEPITVVYGHLKLSSVFGKPGDKIERGDVIGVLGEGESLETDYERKHLHISIHKGPEINTRGYLSSSSELAGWLDPCLYVCGD